jgi:hypothetical protein
MRKLIVTSLICASFSSSADVCRLNESSFDRAVRINGLPGYFFKVHPDGQYLSFISEGNHLLDFNTGEELRLPGSVDPVWSPDGAFLTTPGENDSGMTIYKTGDVIAAAKAKEPNGAAEVIDGNLLGVYQSVGKKGNSYSIITDQNGLTLAQYQSSGGKLSSAGVPQKLCQNVGDFHSDLPMLSRDGEFVSVYDSSSRSTKIYHITGTDCELSVDLGFPTGKVSFNMDSSQISFHVDQFGDFDSGWFSGVSRDKVKNVVSVKLNRKGNKLVPSEWSLVTSTTTPGDGAYYPDFDRQGNIYYLEDKGNFFQFVKVRPDQLQWSPFHSRLFNSSPDCEECGPKPSPSSLEVLASLWTSVCQSSGIDLSRTPVLANAIDPVACRELVSSHWSASLGVSRDELLKACPKVRHSTGTVTGQWDTQKVASGEAIFKSRCLMCHTNPRSYMESGSVTYRTGEDTMVTGETYSFRKTIPAFNSDGLGQSHYVKMQNAISAGLMPKGSSLSYEDKQALNEFLNRKKVDGIRDDGRYWTPDVRRYSPENLAAELKRELDGYPEAPSEIRAQITRSVNCIYGNIDCDKWLVEFEQMMTEKDPQKHEAQLMQMKCAVLAGGVTIHSCFEWYDQHGGDAE